MALSVRAKLMSYKDFEPGAVLQPISISVGMQLLSVGDEVVG
jgi:hypothetical protein